MVGYKFFPPADKSQDEIWDYTYREWGEAQADKYMSSVLVFIHYAAPGQNRCPGALQHKILGLPTT